MVVLLVVNLIWSVLMLMLSYRLATGNALAFYPETVPTMVQCGVAAAVSLAGMFFRSGKMRFGLLAGSSGLLGLLVVAWYYALAHWPGGDDGGGMAWLFLMGGASGLSIVVAVCTFGIGLGLVLRPAVSVGAIPVELAKAGGVRSGEGELKVKS